MEGRHLLPAPVVVEELAELGVAELAVLVLVIPLGGSVSLYSFHLELLEVTSSHCTKI